jgi:hypothetical protein
MNINLRLQNILCIATILFGIISIATQSGLTFLFLLWLMPFGAIQVIHSIVLLSKYSAVSKIKNLLIIYILAVILYFIAFASFGYLDRLLLISVPPILALSFWYITWAVHNYEKNKPFEVDLDSFGSNSIE